MFINLETQEYPLSVYQVRAAFPNTSFSEAHQDFDGFAQVTPTAPPEYEAMTHTVNELPPVVVDGEWNQQWEVVALPDDEAAANVQKARASMMAQIDDAVAAVLTKSTRFSHGYEQREAAALAFKAGGYTGDPTVWVSRFAGNTGMTNKAAADLILSQAAMLRGALEQLEALRMDKYKVKAHPTLAGARAEFTAIMTQVQQIGAAL